MGVNDGFLQRRGAANLHDEMSQSLPITEHPAELADEFDIMQGRCASLRSPFGDHAARLCSVAAGLLRTSIPPGAGQTKFNHRADDE